MRLCVLDLLGAGVELEQVVSHGQLVAELSDLDGGGGVGGGGGGATGETRALNTNTETGSHALPLYLLLGDFKLLVQHFVAGCQLLVLFEQRLADPGRQLQVSLFLS